MSIRRGPDGHIQVVGPHASSCRCFACRQSTLAMRIGVDLRPELEAQSPAPWLAPLFVGGILFWAAVIYWLI